MVGKFAVFFLVAFAASQVSGTIIKPTTYESQVVFGIWDEVQNIINKIKDGLTNIGSQIAEIYKNLKEKIQAIVGNVDIKDLIQKIIDAIKNNIGEVGEVLNECIGQNAGAINDLAIKSRADSLQCVGNAENKLQGITEEASKVMDAGNALMTDVKDQAWNCVKNNIFDPSKMIQCFKDATGDIMTKLVALKNQAVQAVKDAKDIAAEGASELGSCMAKVGQETAAAEELIKNAIQKCISENA